jgi:hypothetical protein
MNIYCKIHNGKVLENFGFKWKVWTMPLTEAFAWESAPHARSKVSNFNFDIRIELNIYLL